MKNLRLLRFLLVVSVVLLACGCKRLGNGIDGENVMTEAGNLAVYDRETYREVVISNSSGREVARYALVNHDAPVPNVGEEVEIIRIPVRGLVMDSEVYAGAIEDLGAVDIIKGMFDADFVTSPVLKDRIATGKVARLGQTSSPNLERIVALGPDAILISYFDGMQTASLEGIGIPVIKMYDLQEQSPLGRAEWIRFLGMLVGKENPADKIFEEVKTAYNSLVTGSDLVARRPKVLTDLMYQGVWYVPGGKSYQARLIRDGGGNYFKATDSHPVTLNLSAEQVLAEARDADIWIIRHYGNADEIRQILASDPVYREIKAFKEGNVYYSDTSESGLFREFPFHPEKLLEDYSLIFSGDTSGNLKYFKKL